MIKQLYHKVIDGSDTPIDNEATVSDAGAGSITISGTSASFTPILTGAGAGSSLTWTYPTSNPLTKEEEAERQLLQDEFDRNIRTQKLSLFKKLHKDLRQRIIDKLMWSEYIQECDNITAAQPDRLRELEARKNPGKIFLSGLQVSSDYGYTNIDFFGNGVKLPDGISSDDLKKAHSEACLEEELNGT